MNEHMVYRESLFILSLLLLACSSTEIPEAERIEDAYIFTSAKDMKYANVAEPESRSIFGRIRVDPREVEINVYSNHEITTIRSKINSVDRTHKQGVFRYSTNKGTLLVTFENETILSVRVIGMKAFSDAMPAD